MPILKETIAKSPTTANLNIKNKNSGRKIDNTLGNNLILEFIKYLYKIINVIKKNKYKIIEGLT